MSLTIDTAASTVKPDDGDVQTWMADQRVFISSVMAGMTDLRAAVAQAVSRIGAEPVWFENFGGRDDEAEAAYLGEVASSTVYVGIFGAAYGRLLKSRLSATHEEFREAERCNLSISGWTERSAHFDGDQVRLVDEVRLFHTTGGYRSADDLAQSVAHRLQDMAAADLSPWVLLDDLVFRARTIRDDGRTVILEATVRNPAVASALEQLRPGDWTKKERRLTYNGRSLRVRIRSIHTTASSRTATQVVVTCEQVVDTDVKMPFSFSVGGRTFSGEEISELLIKQALFGDDVPSSVLTVGGRVDPPLAELPDGLVSDDLRRAVMRLLITDALVRSGRVARVLRLDITPAGSDGRLVDLTWESPASRGRGLIGHVRGRLTGVPGS
jgi:hypothetical protein